MTRSEKRKQYDQNYREKNKEKARNYREENKEKIKEKLKIWRSQNQEKIKFYRIKNKARNKIKVKEYQKKNPQILEKSRKKWAENNKEFLKELRKKYIKRLYTEGYFERYKNKRKFYRKKYLKTEKGITTHLWDKLRLRIKNYTFSKKETSRKDMNNLIGCSKLFLKIYLEKQFYNYPGKKIRMSWKNREEWHIDHITPLAHLDPENDEHFKIANHFSNLKPMWAFENLKKSSKLLPGYGIPHLKRKYKKLQTLGDLTEISNVEEAKKLTTEAIKLINLY